MGHRQKKAQPNAADVLAALSMVSIQRGEIALARVRLIECLNLLDVAGTSGSVAATFEALTGIATLAGDPQRAETFRALGERLRDGRAPTSASAGSTNLESTVADALAWLEDLLNDRHQSEAVQLPDSAASDLETIALPGSTARLVARAREGSLTARERLVLRIMGPLRRFGHGRLPSYARDLVDTDDLVQDTVVRGLDRLGAVRTKQKGSFLAYLKQVMLNRVRDEIRRASRRPRSAHLMEGIPSNEPSPLDQFLSRETMAAYEFALGRLPARQRDAFVLRIELGYSYQQIADAIGCPSANAARMVVSRALLSAGKSLRRS